MTDDLRHAPGPRIYGIYGAAVFGMQAVERSLKVALIEAIIELDKPGPEAKAALKSILESMTLGSTIDRFDGLVRPQLRAECGDLKSYAKNRNYVAHQFFLDYVDAVGDAARDDDAEAFLELCQREAVIALHRMEVMTRELKLPEHTAYTERRDLGLMERLEIEPSERIMVRKFRDA